MKTANSGNIKSNAKDSYIFFWYKNRLCFINISSVSACWKTEKKVKYVKKLKEVKFSTETLSMNRKYLCAQNKINKDNLVQSKVPANHGFLKGKFNVFVSQAVD